MLIHTKVLYEKLANFKFYAKLVMFYASFGWLCLDGLTISSLIERGVH